MNFWIMGAILLSPLALINGLAPLLVLKQVKLTARVHFEVLDEEAFFADRDARFHALDMEIKSLDFEYVGASLFRDLTTTSHFCLYANHTTRTVATLIVMTTESKTLTYAEFSQRCGDEVIVGVCNADQVSIYPRLPIKVMLRDPKIDRMEELYAMLLRLRDALGRYPMALPLDRDRYFQVVEEFVERESDELVKLGYCQAAIDEAGRRSLTVKGAYLLSWKLLFPGNVIKGWSDRWYKHQMLSGRRQFR